MRILTLLISAGLILVILGISLSIGAKITSDVQSTFCSGEATDIDAACFNSTAGGVAANSTLAIGNLASWEGTISTVVAAVVIIGLLLAGFGGFMAFGGKGGV